MQHFPSRYNLWIKYLNMGTVETTVMFVRSFFYFNWKSKLRTLFKRVTSVLLKFLIKSPHISASVQNCPSRNYLWFMYLNIGMLKIADFCSKDFLSSFFVK